MAFGRPDRPPLFEEGLRDDVMEAWLAQGLADGPGLDTLVRYDRRERFAMDLGPRPPLAGRLAADVGLRELRHRLDPDDPGRLQEDWQRRVKEWRERDYPLDLCVHSGFFLTHGADNWERVTKLLLLTHDAPDRVRGVMDVVAECAVGVVHRVLQDVEVDSATFSEPISGPDGPLLGPRMYRDLVLASYAPIVQALREGGCPTIIFQTYSNSRVLLPGVVEAGFNCLWAVESPPGTMDYRDIRREFGRDLRLIGGIDLDLLRQDAATICREVRALLPPLLAEGGYVPLADGRVRPDVPLQGYLAYRRAMEEAVGAASA